MSGRADAASTPDARGESIVYVANADSHDIAVLALDRASGALRGSIAIRPAQGHAAPLDSIGACSMRRSGTTLSRWSLGVDPASGRLAEIGARRCRRACWISTDRAAVFCSRHRMDRASSR
jgi:hypothetical protein